VNYIDRLATEIRQQVPARLVPDGDTDALFRLYAVLLRIKGEAVSSEDVHDAWSAWMSATDPDHPALRPHRELSPATRAADVPYVEAIRAVARVHATVSAPGS
jgi:hypothetical protein